MVDVLYMRQSRKGGLMRIIDISRTISNGMPVFPGDAEVNLIKRSSLETDGFVSYRLDIGLHVGTHIDAPMHMVDDKRFVSDFDISKFIGKGVLLNVAEENPIIMKPDYKQIISEDSIVLLHTGHDRFWSESPEEYYGNYPSVDPSLAEFLVSKKIKMLGMDMPSPDHAPYNIHKILLENDIFLLENLTNLQVLEGVSEFEVMAFPLKITAEGSFVRAVCRVCEVVS